MAISRTQPMREAEIDILDFCDNVDEYLYDVGETLDGFTAENTVASAIDSAIDGVMDVIGPGFDDENTVASALNGEYVARVNADEGISNVIGEGFTNENTVASAIQNIKMRGGTIPSTAGENSKTFTFKDYGEAGFIVIKRGTTACIAIMSYWDANASIIGDDTNVSISKNANSTVFTVTVTTGTNGKGYVIAGNVEEVTE